MNPDWLLHHWNILVFYLLIFFTAVILFYYLFFFTRIAFYKKKTKAVYRTQPVSIVICARDEAQNLVDNLPGIFLQTYPSTHEVIVVNDNSFDESKYILEAFQKEHKQLNVVTLVQEAKMIPGKKFPLSVGIKTAKHELLLLTDADCVPASDHWIESMQDAYDDNVEIVLGYGAYFRQKSFLNKLIRWETYHTALQYMSYAQAGLPYMGVGRNLSYRRSVFFRHKGFSAHNNIASGDDDLFINTAANANNTVINLDKQSFTLSKPATTWQAWRKQKRRHYSTAKHYKTAHKFLLGLYALANFIFFPLLIITAISFSWQYTLIVLGLKWLIQSAVHYFSTAKFSEQDLFPFFPLFDIYNFLHYIIFAGSLFKKPSATWK